VNELTTVRTIGRGSSTELGWRELVWQRGEAHVGAPPRSSNGLAAIWHLSDLHLCDAESPGRQEYLDRYSDPDSPYRDLLGDVGTYRPQEAFTTQVALSMFDVVNRLESAPVTDRAFDAVLVTGDIIDNAQANELDWYITLIHGGTLQPWSGSVTHNSWVGVSNADGWDDRYWHPDGPAMGQAPDRPSRIYGFPEIPGLIDATRRELHCPGVVLPIVSVHGNHDALLQGTVHPDDRLRKLLVGDRRIIGLAPKDQPTAITGSISAIGPARYLDPGSFVSIPPDSRRSALNPGDFAKALGNSEKNYWMTDIGDIRLIVLDTVNPHGGWQGSLDEEQFDWLASELAHESNQYVVIASHHPSPSMINDYAPQNAGRRILGQEVLHLLTAHRRVIAWLAGHVHHHSATWHRGRNHEGGIWEITTASLIDWPQQARVIEFIQENDAIAIVSTVVNHDAPLGWRNQDVNDYRTIAATSRSLAANDYRLRGGELRGLFLESWPHVRNAVWRVPV